MNDLPKPVREDTKLDEAARAGWLYYVAGNTQDEIARKLGVSRQSVQRLVAMAVSERLVKVRIDHPIARCMELGAAICARFDLQSCEVVPSDPGAPGLLTGVAIAAAAEMERHLKSPEPRIIALGTGRALRACIEQLSMMSCPQHRIVSRLGNIMSDGSATPFNAVIRMADRVGAPHYPMPLPVLLRDAAEVALMHSQGPVHNTLDLCTRADVTFVGVGQMDATAPMVLDGFITEAEVAELQAQGVVGEITSFAYDSDGKILSGVYNTRVASAPLRPSEPNPVFAIASGAAKVPAILGAMRGRLISALITNEDTATRILAS
jgi:DNA-binding transcriptional regulator LsrR (DeoR family)